MYPPAALVLCHGELVSYLSADVIMLKSVQIEINYVGVQRSD
jgi:hypothetical protein